MSSTAHAQPDDDGAHRERAHAAAGRRHGRQRAALAHQRVLRRRPGRAREDHAISCRSWRAHRRRVAENAGVLLADLVTTSAAVAATRSRLAKVAALADCLRRAEPGEIAIVTSYLSGELRQRRTGVGWASLRDLPRPGCRAERRGGRGRRRLRDASRACRGPARRGARRELLAALFARATAEEQRFLAMLAGGELRQGALAGIVTDAVAAAAGVPAAAGAPRRDARRRSPRRRRGRADGGRGRPRRVPSPGRAARAADAREDRASLAAALAQTGRAAVEWKLDGVRIQVHREGDEVAIFTRTLDPVSERMPEIVEAVRALPLRSVILDGEAIALRAGRAAAAVPGDREPRGEPRRQRSAARGGAADAVLLRRPAPRRPRPPRPAGERAARRDRAAPARPAPGCRASSPPTRTRRRRSPPTRSRAGTKASS